jgi:hypothetical protein
MLTCQSCGSHIAFYQSFELPGDLPRLDWETLLSDQLCPVCFRHWFRYLQSLDSSEESGVRNDGNIL